MAEDATELLIHALKLPRQQGQPSLTLSLTALTRRSMKTLKRPGEARSHCGFEIWIRAPFQRSLGMKFVVNSAPD
jgi:hypothetical protein